jgi:hypothetical protein
VACNLLKAVFVGLGEMEDKFVTDLSLAATALQPMLMLRAIPRDLRERAKAAVEQLALDESNRLEQQVAQQQLLDQQQPTPVSPVITEDDVAAVPDLSSDVSFVFSDEEEEEERDTSVTDELSMYWRERGQQTTDPNGRSIPDLNANPLSWWKEHQVCSIFLPLFCCYPCSPLVRPQTYNALLFVFSAGPVSGPLQAREEADDHPGYRGRV